MWIRTGVRLLLAAAFCSLLAACASSSGGKVKVVDRNQADQTPATTSGQYTVRRGDTLYSIAFRYGWDWKALAAHNNIQPPYTIRPGQSIRFGGTGAAAQPVVAKTTPSVAPVVVSKPSASSPAPTKPVATASASNPPSPASSAPSTPVAKGAEGWMWPTNGTLIGRFASNGSLNKGIDIAGQLGQPVLAASSGTVVYAGSGLRGYGELVIIKHSDTYVSAYGHNRRLLVREGQQVKVGQSIAEMGSTGTDRVKLHFEIRRQGKPVDPLQYLPPR
ncbi:peptidoglycan DD-metalloendopeptidase family protein [Pseudomonas citronellolis]|uniref:peptidoglycan DD-metalloendopeptidase family protein n=1 Tax=Pseudomonas citronellolis TaxID=53408 RepID=UPI003D3343B8